MPARAFQTFFRAGRRLDCLEFGDPAGRPVVFFHQNCGLCRWPASAETAAEAMCLRVLVPIRAGYGASEDAPQGGEYAACVAADPAALLDRLHLPAAQAITLGSDFQLAAHFAATRRGRMPVILACAGVLPMTSADHCQRMHKWHRFILAGGRYTPHLLPFMVKEGFHLARRNGKQAFVDSVFGKTRADLAAFADPEVFEAMLTGSEIALSANHTAHEAYARQIIQQETTDWRPLVAALEGRVRVVFFNGMQDPKVAPETLDAFRAEYPWIDWRIHDDAGALAFFRHWPDVLAAPDPA